METDFIRTLGKSTQASCFSVPPEDFVARESYPSVSLQLRGRNCLPSHSHLFLLFFWKLHSLSFFTRSLYLQKPLSCYPLMHFLCVWPRDAGRPVICLKDRQTAPTLSCNLKEASLSRYTFVELKSVVVKGIFGHFDVEFCGKDGSNYCSGMISVWRSSPNSCVWASHQLWTKTKVDCWHLKTTQIFKSSWKCFFKDLYKFDNAIEVNSSVNSDWNFIIFLLK